MLPNLPFHAEVEMNCIASYDLIYWSPFATFTQKIATRQTAMKQQNSKLSLIPSLMDISLHILIAPYLCCLFFWMQNFAGVK